MKAVVLAAGEGTRLRPLTNVRPKPMIPVANRPVLEYVVRALADAGIDEIVLVVGYKRERIQNHFGDGDDWGVDIEYAVQEKQLGTGHAILQAEPHVDGPFVALNGDRVIESGVVADTVDAAGDGVAVAVTRVENPRYYGVVELAGDRVVSIQEKPHPHETRTDIINAGVYAFGPDVFDEIRATDSAGELAITDTIDRYVDRGAVRVVRYRGQWLDVSHLWDVLGVNASLLDGAGGTVAESADVADSAVVHEHVVVGENSRVESNATLLPGTAVGDNVRVGANAVVGRSVVMQDTVVDHGAVLLDGILAADAVLGPGTTVEGGPADVVVHGTVYEDVDLGAVVGDYARVGGNVTVSPGAVVGNGARVEGGVHLRDRVPPESEVRGG